MRSAGTVTRELQGRSLGIALGVVLLALACASSAAGEGVALWTSLALLPPVVAAVWRRKPHVSRPTWPTLGLLAAVLAWFGVASLRASEPLVSLVGLVGQHTGWLLLFSAGAWFTLSALLGTHRDFRALLVIGALGGAVFALAGLADAAGLLRGYRYSPEVAGLLESSSSLGQLLVLGIGCSTAWGLLTRSIPQRVAAAIAGVLSLACLAASDSRGAWVGLACGVVLTLIAAAMHRLSWRHHLMTVLAVVLPLIILAGTWALAEDVAGPGVRALADRVSSGRVTIWHSAIARIERDPLAARGLDEFSAWNAWDSVPAVSIDETAAYDPHDLLFSTLLAGGPVGLGLVLALLAVLLSAVLRVDGESGDALPLQVLTAGLVAWVASLMFAWITPAAAVEAAMLAGGMLALSRRPEASPRTVTGVRTVALALGAAGLLAAIACVPALSAELRWARITATPTSAPSAAELTALYERWPDPAYAAAALTASLRQAAVSLDATQRASALDAARTLYARAEPHCGFAVDLPFDGMQIEQAAGALLGQDTFARMVVVAADGRRADPASGLWDYYLAVEASRTGRATTARHYARAALSYRLPAEVRRWARALAASR